MAISQCGYYCFCSFQLALAKQASCEQLLKQLPENLLTKICVQHNEKEIQWEEEGKEFSLNGEMYDVVKVKHEGEKEYLLCLSDKKEAKVLETLEKLVKSDNENSTGSGKHTGNKIILPEWTWESLSITEEGDFFINIAKQYHNDKSALHSSFIEINSPPPDFNI
jgi:hypothetical protein